MISSLRSFGNHCSKWGKWEKPTLCNSRSISTLLLNTSATRLQQTSSKVANLIKSTNQRSGYHHLGNVRLVMERLSSQSLLLRFVIVLRVRLVSLVRLRVYSQRKARFCQDKSNTPAKLQDQVSPACGRKYGIVLQKLVSGHGLSVDKRYPSISLVMFRHLSDFRGKRHPS